MMHTNQKCCNYTLKYLASEGQQNVGLCSHALYTQTFPSISWIGIFPRPVCLRKMGPCWKSTHSAVFNRCCYLYVVVLLPTGGWIWNCRDWVGRLGEGGDAQPTVGWGIWLGVWLGRYSTLPERWGRSIGTLFSTQRVLSFLQVIVTVDRLVWKSLTLLATLCLFYNKFIVQLLQWKDPNKKS